MNRHTLLGRRVLSRAAGLEPRAAARIRAVAARMLQGDEVSVPELVDAFPKQGGRGGMVSLGVGYDFETGELYAAEPYRNVGGAGRLGVMSLNGPIYFNCGLWEVLILGCIPTALICQAFDDAAADGAIGALLIDMHCPGGSVDGASDLAAAIDRYKASGKKLYAIAHEMMASMGMWIGAAADRVFATPTGMLGSVGTLIPMYDDSAFFQEIGIVPKPIASDPHKAVGWPGVPLTDENTADLRRMVELHFGEFAARVARGRGMSVEAVTATRAAMYQGQDAVDIGFADELVSDFDSLVARLSGGETFQNRSPAGGQPGARPPQEEPMRTVNMTTPPGPEASDAERKAYAKREWDADHQGCRSSGRFISDKVYEAARAMELGGRVVYYGSNRAGGSETTRSVGPSGGTLPADHKAAAKREWDANTGGCRQNFWSEQIYVAYRARELADQVRSRGNRAV